MPKPVSVATFQNDQFIIDNYLSIPTKRLSSMIGLSEGIVRRRLRLLHRQKLRKKAAEPKFQTKQVDYATLTAVRIDHKTIIYVKPGRILKSLRRCMERDPRQTFCLTNYPKTS